MSLTADESARLTMLKGVYDKLICGQNVVRAQYNGFETMFGAGDKAAISAEIQKLEQKRDHGATKLRGALRFKL